MRVYQRAGKFDLTDDDGHLIEAGFDNEEAALRKAEVWQKSKERWDKRPSRSTLGPAPVEANPRFVTLDVPDGRSWFVTRPKGTGWTVEEHRVAPKATGTDSINAKDDLRPHHCATEAEMMRRRRSLSDQGLFDAGVAP